MVEFSLLKSLVPRCYNGAHETHRAIQNMVTVAPHMTLVTGFSHFSASVDEPGDLVYRSSTMLWLVEG